MATRKPTKPASKSAPGKRAQASSAQAKTAKGEAHIALLRAINVGGNNKLPMVALAELFVQAGCHDVKTYIQSGNVVFWAPAAVARRVAASVTAAIAKQFGFQVPVVTRTAAELAAVTRVNPYLKRRGVEPKALHVAFLSSTPTAAQIAALDPRRSPPDELSVLGSEIYLHLPNGVGKSKLTNQYFDSKLGTISTIRNWNTVQTLLELAGLG